MIATLRETVILPSPRDINSSCDYALQRLQAQMAGEGKTVGLMTDEDVAAWITASRREEETE